jgi:hypothetical protein
MDALASPVLLRGYGCLATNKRTDGVSIGPARCYTEKTRRNTVQFSSVPSASSKTSVQCPQSVATDKLVVNHKRS